MSGFVIIRCIIFSFIKCIVVVGNLIYFNDVKLIKWKKKIFGFLDNNGFLIFLDYIFLIVIMNVYEVVGLNNSYSRIIILIKFFIKYVG